MRRLIAYHLITALPLIGILAAYIFGVMGAGLFAILMLGYAFAFRPYIDYLKLKRHDLVKDGDFWKAWNPFFRFRFYTTLMWKP